MHAHVTPGLRDQLLEVLMHVRPINIFGQVLFGSFDIWIYAASDGVRARRKRNIILFGISTISRCTSTVKEKGHVSCTCMRPARWHVRICIRQNKSRAYRIRY